MDLNAGGS
uniref:Uncharacterized protein n=1 Tax=Arundo donax TaxID=35708 RepID=A0A0A9A5F4_ARUDO